MKKIALYLKKRIAVSIILSIIINFFYMKTINASIEVYSDTGGESIPLYLPECVRTDGEGCGNLSQNFEVRATLVDENNYIYPGTKTIGLQPSKDITNENWDYYVVQSDKNEDPNGWSQTIHIDPNTNQYWEFVGSSIAKQGDTTSEAYITETPIYEIPMSYKGYYEPNDFSTYKLFKEDFIDESNAFSKGTNGDGKYTYIDHDYIYVPEATSYYSKYKDKKYVTFLDFFLHMSGFTESIGYPDEWFPLENPETLIKMQEIVKEKKMKILIEPVYSMGLTHNGKDHSFRGTAKQLSTVIANSDNSTYEWFWPAIKIQNRYNLYCHFQELYDTSFGDTNSLCDDMENFNPLIRRDFLITKTREHIYNALGNCTPEEQIKRAREGRAIGTACDYANKQIKELEKIKEWEEKNGIAYDKIREIYRDLANPNTTYGLNILDITSIVNETTPIKEKTNYCEYSISTCKNNNFEFEAELKLGNNSDGELFDCVYPSDASKINRDEMKKISFYDEEKDLWCYDNIKYSFTNLLMINNINNKRISNNQLVTIPDGELTINRTCYSKKDLNFISDINKTFEANTNEQYQKQFNLVFNGDIYTYLRDNNYEELSKSINLKTNNKTNEEYYEFNSTLKYNYKINKGYRINDGINIDIRTSNLFNGKSTNQSISYNNLYNGSAVMVKGVKVEKTYNALSTSEEEFSTKLQQALGLSNKLYNAITKENKTRSVDENTSAITDNWQKEVISETETQKWTNKYTINEEMLNTCVFSTNIDNLEKHIRIISLSNPFPARDGSSRMPGTNWLSEKENNVYEYIQNNRNVNAEEVYNKEPLYTVTLDTKTMIKIREYNKTHSYTNTDIVCEEGKGRKCISEFLRNDKYIDNIKGKCVEEVDSNNTKEYYECADKTEKSGG